ncbi:hypothetical protein Tco_1297686 [Tanacetum coccineum]
MGDFVIPTVDNTRRVSYTNVVSTEPTPIPGELSRKSVNFRTLLALESNGVDVAILLKYIRVISECFANTVYGFFFGKRVAYPVVANYVKNTWSKYGLVKSMLNSSNGLFFFKFSSKDGIDEMLKNEDVGNVPVRVKFHGFHMTAFSEDGLSAIATKLGTPLMLDSYIFDMCMQPWGRLIYARAMIEIRVDVELKDIIVVAMPKLIGEGFYIPVSNKNDAITIGNKKQAEVSRQEVSNSNQFDVLNLVENDDDLGTNRGDSKATGKGSSNVAPGSSSATLIVEKIDKLERQILDGRLMFVDDEGKPLYKVVSIGITDSDSEVWKRCSIKLHIIWLQRV